MTTETETAVKLLPGAMLGGGDRVRLRDGRTGVIVMTTYMFFSGKPPEYGIAIDGKDYPPESWPRYDHIPESDIAEQLSIGRHSYWKGRGARQNRTTGEIFPADPRGICRRCGQKKSTAHEGEK